MRIFHTFSRQKGYVLPATIVLGLATSIVSIGLLQATSISSQSLNITTYQQIAQEAANAGLNAVQSCVQEGTTSWTTLTPITDCGGAQKTTADPNTNLDISSVAHDGTNWRSSYSVGTPAPPVNNLLTALSVGTVKLYNSAGLVIGTYTAKAKITLPSIPNTEKVATGNAITDIKNENSDCAIANGDLYCWGDNSAGQLGRGYTGNGNDPVTGASVATPQKVQGALAGKTVTNISVANTGACAIADGTAYCWGYNSNTELGYGGGNINIPTNNIPVNSSGPLNGHTVVEISTASGNLPTAYWPLAITGAHSCARTEDGAVSCWGFGAYGQLTGGGCIGFFFSLCGFPSSSTPILVDGYANTTGPFDGMKAERVGASSHDSCLVAQGNMYCWGVKVPLYLGCNTVDFHPYPSPAIPGAGCAQLGMGMYDMSNASGSAISGKFIDNNAWELSTNESCMMVSINFYCTGITPAFTNPFISWFDAWKSPWQVAGSVNVTSSDNGADPGSPGLNGLYCGVTNGKGYCSGNFGNTTTGTNIAGDLTLHPLVTTNASCGSLCISSKNGTKIAAGTNHGCIVANGQLLCWGAGLNGVLADGNKNAHTQNNAKVSGNPVVGIDDGTFAANDSISVGKDFACGIVNSQTFCWGDNNAGKLGLGQTNFTPGPNNRKQPQRLEGLKTLYSTKVSAGKDHACAIANAQLYCWGNNAKGQLGIGTNGNQNATPQLVGNGAGGNNSFLNKRVTDVSAGDSNTCAVADSQLYCWGDNSHRQLGNNDLLHIEKDSPILVNNDGIGHNLHTDMNVTAVTVGTDHACAIANGDAYCWGNNANGKTGIGSILLDSDPTLLNQGTAGTNTATGGDPGPNNMRPLVSAISAGTNNTCAIINAKVSCWGSNANGVTAQNTTLNLPTPTIIPTQVKGTAKDYYATAISVGDTHACAVLNGNSSSTNGNLFCWGSGANGKLGDKNQNFITPSNVTQVSNIPVSNVNNTINGSGTDNDNIGKSTVAISAGYNSTCDIAKGDIQCWGLGSSGQIGNGQTASQLLPTITSDYVIAVYVKPKIY